MAGPSFTSGSGLDPVPQALAFRAQDATHAGPRGMSGYAPATFRNIIVRPVAGPTPDVVPKHWGALYGDQPGHINMDGPADVDNVQLQDGHGAVLQNYGPVASVDQGDDFTIPGEDLPGLGWYSMWNLAAAEYDDPKWGRTQGGMTMCVVPILPGMPTLPPAATPYYGRDGVEYDAAVWAVMGCLPARITVSLHSSTLAAQQTEASAVKTVSDTYWLPYDTGRLRSDGAPTKPYLLAIPDFRPGDGAALTTLLGTAPFAAMATTGRLIVSLTNESADDGTTNDTGYLTAAYAPTQREAYLAIKAANSAILVGTAPTLGVGPLRVATYKGFVDACLALAVTHGEASSAPYFDVVNIHNYNQGEGAPGYGPAYYGPYVALLEDPAYNGAGTVNLGSKPRMISEFYGYAARQEGAAYPWRQAARVMLDFRWAAQHGFSKEYIRYFDGFGGHPWHPTSPIQQSTIPQVGGQPFPVVGLHIVRSFGALAGTSQDKPKRLTFSFEDVDYDVRDAFMVGSVHRAAVTVDGPTKGQHDPAGTAVVELQSVGDPNAQVVLQLSRIAGTGALPATVDVWDAHGCRGTLAVAGGKVTVTRAALMGHDATARPDGVLQADCSHRHGLLFGAYVFLPAGIDAVAVDPDPDLPPLVDPSNLGVSSSTGSIGTTNLNGVIRPPLRNNLLRDSGNADRNTFSMWQAGASVATGQEHRLHITFPVPHRVRWALIPSAPPWQRQCALYEAAVLGKLAGVEAPAATDIDVETLVQQIRSDAFTFSGWFLLSSPDEYVQTRYMDAPLDELIIASTRWSWGSAPSLEALSAEGDCTIVLGSATGTVVAPEDVIDSQEGFIGAGFGGAPYPTYQTFQIRGEPVVPDIPVPVGGTPQYVVLAPLG